MQSRTTLEIDGQKITINNRQRGALRRLWRNEIHCDSFSSDLAKQLEAKGLAWWSGNYYEPKEWNRITARLRTMHLTTFGETVCEQLFEASEQ